MNANNLINYFTPKSDNPLIKMSNKLSVVLMMAVGCYGLIFAFWDAMLELYNTSLVNLFAALVALISLIVIKNEKFLLAKVIMIGGVTLVLCAHCILFTQQTAISLYAIPLFMCAIVIFRGKHLIQGIIISSLCATSIVCVIFSGYHPSFAYSLTEDALNEQRLINIGGVIILCLVIIYFIVKINENIHKVLLEKKREIELSNSILKETIFTRDKLFSLIAHDLKGPFQSMSASLEILSATDTTSEDKEMVINHLAKKSKNTIILLNNLLLWAQHQTESIKFRPETIKLSGMEKTMKETFDIQAAEKGIKLSFNFPENAAIYADKNMVECVLRNLISNAIKYTEPDGEIEVFGKVEGLKIVFSIKDNGVGMDDLVKEMLLTKQAYTSLGTKNEQGHGLGMMLIHEFLKMHKSELEINSEPNKGSEFVFHLNAV